jgi:PAS domain S-box-containing protein
VRGSAPPDQQDDFSLAVFGANDGLWDWDIRTDTVAFSARWKAMLGYEEDEGGNDFAEWQSRIHPDDRDQALATLEAYLAGEAPFYELEHRLRHRDGTYRWVLARGMALWDEQGEPYRLAGSHTDITKRKEAEEQLRESEALYRALVNTSPDSIVLTDLSGKIVMVNSRATELYGYSVKEDMIGMNALQLIAPEERERTEQDFGSAAKQGCLRDREYVQLRRDGSRFPAEMSAALITDINGQSTALICVARDVSERKRAEKRLRERDEQYRSIFEATSDGIIINDLDGFVVEANPAACAIHGYAREEFIGLHRTAYVHPDYHDALPGYIETIKVDGFVHTRGVNTRKDGSSFPVEIHGTEFVYWGKPRILALVRDVTEQVQAQELLEKRVMERTRELFTLLEVSRQVASTLHIQPLLSVILDQLKGVVDYEGGALLKLSGEDLVIVEYRGPNSREEVVGLRFPLARIEAIWELARQGQPVMICDVRGDSPLARTFREAAGPLMDGIWRYVRSWMGVPLVQKGKTIGLLSLSIDVPDFYSDEQAHLALAFASQAAAAIENARLYTQAQDAAVLEERARLARELHDSVTQALFSMTMHAEAAKVSLEREGDWVNVPSGARALRNLRQLAELTEGALAEMRALIFELRPGALQEEGLGAALRNHAGALSAREGIPIEVEVPDVRVQAEPSTEEHLYRFAQEALHNVIKHAGASHAVIRLRAEENGRLVLEIEDDGTGFDPAGVPAGHLGLRTMSDRVEQIGGTTEIQSVPGRGTLVRAVTPETS